MDLKRVCIIVDLDGTLSDCDHRRHFVEQKNWPAFYEGMGADPVQPWCRTLLCWASDHVDIVLVSGRPEEYRGVTQSWLLHNDVPWDKLFMRPKADFRQDSIVKEEILKREILPLWDVHFAVDDRKQVVEMWRRNGIVTLQCAEGDF